MMIPQPLSQLGDLARRPGRRVLCSPKTAAPSISNATVASPAAPGLELSTGIALAFPRGPFVPAAAAWELQEATSGKFQLGLG
ncbi:LLM class flavin-dependent oxidoreductase, partial [Mycobacterium tuberculosis]